LINFKYEVSLAPAFAFRCLSSLRCEGHLSASCPAPNSNSIFTNKFQGDSGSQAGMTK
jgi:hypothetical protein